MWELTKVILLVFLSTSGNSECDQGWTEYNNEKCYKVLDEFVTRENADILCAAAGSENEIPVVLTISAITEQTFISTLLFGELQIFDSVWLGATRFNETSFQWADGTNLVYNNWDTDYPTDNLVNNCTQVTSSVSKGDVKLAEGGLWRDVPCTKRNLVVCQKDSTLSLKELQTRLFKMEKNPVPIGFIYTQYGRKPDPEQIWPGLVWKSVTDEYAGRFFRAEGGESAAFGSAQADNTHQLDQAQYNGSPNGFSNSISISAGNWSSFLLAGLSTSGYSGFEGIRFHVSSGEVRPINQAVRMWERIG